MADVLLPLVEQLLEDRERVIRLAVLQQLPALGELCTGEALAQIVQELHHCVQSS